VQPNVILLFEVMDFVTSPQDLSKYPDGWNRIAWGFLKLVGEDGKANTEKDVRLQLYRYPFRLFPKIPKGPIAYVYHCYREPRRKYSSTLYVKVSSQKTMDEIVIGRRPMLPNETEESSVPIDEVS
jgi:jouberin